MQTAKQGLVGLVVCVVTVSAWAGAVGPVPMGEADVTFTYMTDAGPRVLQDSFDYSARGPQDVEPLGDSDIGYFNSVNRFGRRPLIDGAMRDGESLLAHALFKPMPRDGDFFEDMSEGSDLILEVQNIQFDEVVYFEEDTFLMHRLFDADQVDQLDEPYINLHNHGTGTDPFRDFDAFFPRVFTDAPIPNYALGSLAGRIEYFGEGTQTLGFRVTVPYSVLDNFENNGQQVPDGLPAPFGFLEPFHFHYEFVVSNVPEPASGALLLAAAGLMVRRRRGH